MNLTFMNLVVLFSMGFVVALFTLLGVMVGAYVVYRTKREGHEPFLNMKQPEGDAGQAEGYYAHEFGDEELPLGSNVDKIVYGTADRRKKFYEDLMARSGKDDNNESSRPQG